MHEQIIFILKCQIKNKLKFLEKYKNYKFFFSLPHILDIIDAKILRKFVFILNESFLSEIYIFIIII